MAYWKMGALGLSLAILPVCAQAMTVADWMQRMETLKSRGSGAKSSPDMMALQSEVAAAATGYRAQIRDARAKGTPPRACPPERVSLSSDDLMAEFRKLPRPLYVGQVAVAFGAIMDKRYPCTGEEKSTPPSKAATI